MYYGYDTLNNLTTVNQGVQTRTFTYNSLSRLLSATNPESGTINYSYAANGNLTSKVDARTITTTYTYDALDRIVTSNYSDSTPDVTYYYDNLTNGKGRLKKVTSSVSTTEYTSFDILGRVTGHKQTTDGEEYATDYTYNLSGALMEETYPSGRVVKNVLDNNGGLSMVQSKKDSGDFYRPYASNFAYNAAGAVMAMKLGNGLWETSQVNSRLQLTQIGLGHGPAIQDLLKLNYDYGTTDNNGNVTSQTITVPTVGASVGFIAVQNYTYDSLNRINDAVENITPVGGSSSQAWKQAFTYDRYGNRNFDEANTTQPASFANPDVTNPTVDAANNRFASGQGYSYDLSGNTTADALDRTYIYDAENKQVEVLENSVSLGKYFYDGDGKRVKKISDNETVIFVYDAGGKLVAEYANQTSQTPKISYLTNDHLGSPRITTDELGHVISRRDFHPFDEEIYRSGYGLDSVLQKFTGYERDEETDLDYAKARMYANTLGKFTSPDPLYFQISMASDPQRFNLFGYSRNNPFKFVDLNGEKVTVAEGSSINDFYLMVGGQETFDKYFEFKDGQISLKEGVDLGNVNEGAQLLGELTASSDNFLVYLGSDARKAASLFQGTTKSNGKLNYTGTFIADRFKDEKYLVGTMGRFGSVQPDGDAFTALAIDSKNLDWTQSGVDLTAYSNPDIFLVQSLGKGGADPIY